MHADCDFVISILQQASLPVPELANPFKSKGPKPASGKPANSSAMAGPGSTAPATRTTGTDAMVGNAWCMHAPLQLVLLAALYCIQQSGKAATVLLQCA